MRLIHSLAAPVLAMLIGTSALLSLHAAASAANNPDVVQLRKGLGIPRTGELKAGSLRPGESQKVLVELAPVMKTTMGILSTTGSVVEQLGLSGVSDLIEFKHVPYLALTATPDILSRLLASPLVGRVLVDDIYVADLSQSKNIIHTQDAWKHGAQGKGVSVAVLDTGVDTTHKAFAGRIAGEACFSSNGSFNGNRVTSACPGQRRSSTARGAGRDCPAQYDCSHGTHVAGIVAGGDSRYGGVAPAAEIVAIQVFSLVDGPACGRSRKCATAYTSDIINAMEWVYDKRKTLKVAAVNMSLGGGRYTNNCDREAIARAVNLLDKGGVAVVIASGNNGYNNAVTNPGCVSRAITVGSTDKRDRVSDFSNVSGIVDLWAPGSSIRSAVPGGGYGTKSGTSMAAPHVAGAIAVLRAAYPGASQEEITQIIKTTGPRIRDPRSGVVRNRLDLGAAYGEASKRWGDGKKGGTPPPSNDNDGGGGLLDVVPGLGGLLGGGDR